MIQSIRRWLGLCPHRWVDVGLVRHYFLELGPESPHKYTMRQRCEHCGRYRQTRY